MKRCKQTNQRTINRTSSSVFMHTFSACIIICATGFGHIRTGCLIAGHIKAVSSYKELKPTCFAHLEIGVTRWSDIYKEQKAAKGSKSRKMIFFARRKRYSAASDWRRFTFGYFNKWRICVLMSLLYICHHRSVQYTQPWDSKLWFAWNSNLYKREQLKCSVSSHQIAEHQKGDETE